MNLKNPIPGLLDAAASLTGISVDKLMELRRHKRHVATRWCVFDLARKSGMSLTEIADEFDMDHGSVMYGLRQLPAGIRRDRWIAGLYAEMEKLTETQTP